MDFSAPSPASSSSDSRSSYSPRLMSSDLGLDPSDPLNLLLHNSSQSYTGNSLMEESSSQDGGSPPDWSQLSSLWPDNELGGTPAKPSSDVMPMDFSELASLAMDVDFGNAIAIEPSALHFNPMKYTTINASYSYDPHTPSYADDILAAQFPFTFQPQHDSTSPSSDASSYLSSQSSQRRLSITSSASSSGVSLSPAPESITSPVPAKQHTESTHNYPSPSDHVASNAVATDPASELAERVRQSAGVMLALPMSAQLQALENQQTTPPAASPTSLPKLPIPRLNPRPTSQSTSQSSPHATKSTTPSTTSSAASTPPPSTPPPTSFTSSAAPTPSVSSAPLTRPKTSHTTIERRYRTNLNARIQSLRMAVPALRVVEDRDSPVSGKKRAPNKVLVSSDPLNLHLKQEAGGTGINGNGVDVIDERGFVDGVKVARKCSKANVLGKAVEYIRVLKKREHRLKAEQAGLKALVAGLVGGPALLREWEREWRAMFGGEERDEVEGEMDGEGGEEDDDDGSEAEDGEDEDEAGRKRKRGKTAPASTKEKKEKKPTTGTDGTAPEKRKRGRPRKVVQPPAPVPAPVPAQDQMITEQSHGQGPQQYLLATFALFSFFNSPLTSSSPSSPSHVHTGTVLNGSSPALQVDAGWGISEYIQMFHLFVSVVVLLGFVSSCVGSNIGSGKLMRGGSVLKAASRERKPQKNVSDWVAMGEECVLSPEIFAPLHTRLQIYYNITSWTGVGVGPSELTTAALTLHGVGGVLGGLARSRARAVWRAAKAKAVPASRLSAANGYERMVLEELSVDAAAARLSNLSVGMRVEQAKQTPMQVLACTLVRERTRAHLGKLFVKSVVERADDEEGLEMENNERMRTVVAAKDLGGRTGQLGRRLERVWKNVGGGDERSENSDGEEDGEVEALLAAIVLYRKVFVSVGSGASALLSPPPSPGKKDGTDVGRLRRALGSRVFEESAALEDARDQAVDLVVELERRSVGLD